MHRVPFRSGAGGECCRIRASIPTTPWWFLLTAAARSASAVRPAAGLVGALSAVWWSWAPTSVGGGCEGHRPQGGWGRVLLHSHSNPAHPMGADQLGPGQRGANQTGAAQVGSGQVCAAQVEVGQMVANQLGAGCGVPARRVPARCVPAIWELSRAHVRHLTRALGGSLKVPRTRLFPRSTWDEVVKTCRRPRRQRGRHPLLTCCRHGGCPVRRLVVPGARLQHGHPCGHQLGRGHLLFSYNVATSAWDQLFHRSAVGWGRVLLHSRLNPHHPRVVVLTAAALSAAAVDLLSARWGPRPPLVVRGTYSWGGAPRAVSAVGLGASASAFAPHSRPPQGGSCSRRQRGRHLLLTCCRFGGGPVRRLVVKGAHFRGWRLRGPLASVGLGAGAFAFALQSCPPSGC